MMLSEKATFHSGPGDSASSSPFRESRVPIRWPNVDGDENESLLLYRADGIARELFHYPAIADLDYPASARRRSSSPLPPAVRFLFV